MKMATSKIWRKNEPTSNIYHKLLTTKKREEEKPVITQKKRMMMIAEGWRLIDGVAVRVSLSLSPSLR